MILLCGSRPDTSNLPTVESIQATLSNPSQSEADCSKGKAKQKRNGAQLEGPRL
jgi:hypothetical protein